MKMIRLCKHVNRIINLKQVKATRAQVFDWLKVFDYFSDDAAPKIIVIMLVMVEKKEKLEDSSDG